MASPLRQLSACARRLSQWSFNELSSSFPELGAALVGLDFEFRERLFSPVVTFWFRQLQLAPLRNFVLAPP